MILDSLPAIFCYLLFLVHLWWAVARGCDSGWSEFESNCYYFPDTTDTWLGGNADCIRRGSFLCDPSEGGQVRYVGYNTRRPVTYLGVQVNVGGGVVNYNGNGVNYNNFPPNRNSGYCYQYPNQWRSDGPDVEKCYVCQTRYDSTIGCPGSYRQWRSKCYNCYHNQRRNFYGSRHSCQGWYYNSIARAEVQDPTIAALQGDLVSIEDQAEMDFVSDLISGGVQNGTLDVTDYVDTNFWMGLELNTTQAALMLTEDPQASTVDAWHWTSPTYETKQARTTYSNWYPDSGNYREPSYGTCGSIYPSRWNTCGFNSGYRYGYTCRRSRKLTVSHAWNLLRGYIWLMYIGFTTL
ncbi:unnamed protein product [Darwinula stevensoni]|uniref:C-type lectin domain-containing protein n=1 Tax=Darwinula stevensoni TaxID=69355 RepID=A0A7R9AHK0_9CRUS|nr:unnamed protein product [Darwinula stevensoni]CAG0904842.1 unnamed protein product [Darwinula stevensoni]